MRKVAKSNCKKEYGKEMSRLVQNHFGEEAIGDQMKQLLAKSSKRILQKYHATNTIAKRMNKKRKRR